MHATPPRSVIHHALLVGLSAAACQPAATPTAPATARTPAPAVEATESPAQPRSAASPGEPVRYDLRFADAQTHMIDVEISLPDDLQDDPSLWMAAWTPGSYLIREYARQVEGVEARDAAGSPLPITRVAKNRWAVEGTAATVHYRLYANARSVRASFVDGELGVINGAATYLFVDGTDARAHRVVAHPSPGWAGSYTGLDASKGGGAHDWTAADIDELIDSPIVFGAAAEERFTTGERDHRLVVAGTHDTWEMARATADVEAIVAATHALWGTVPYAHYTFLNLSIGGRGGLEHLDSTLMISGQRVMSQRKSYLGWLGLVSHEFFHTWNVKRLRPAPLGPFDYEAEVYTPSLWVAEGLTSYYDDLLLIRAGLMTEAEYLERITDQVGKLQDIPGRGVQTLAAASSEAWIKHYRKDENTVNTAISYYTKGMAVGWLLDASIRRATAGEKSLDDALRLAFSRFAGERGYTPADFEGVLLETVGPAQAPALEAFLDTALRTTDELDYTPALAWWGLRWKSTEPGGGEDGEGDQASGGSAPPADPPPGWIGAELEPPPGRATVVRVKRGTPAHDAGLQVGDELIAINGWRLPPKGPDGLLAGHRPGETVTLTLNRRRRLRTVPLTLGELPPEDHVLEIDPEATPAAAARRRAWLGLPAPEPTAATE